MTTIVTRTGKGSPLTHVEVDTNFTNLNTAKLEADSSGRLLVGTGTARQDFYNTTTTDPRVQIEGVGTTSPGYILQSWIVNHNSATVTPHLVIGKSRGSTNGSVTIVQNGDSLGHFDWHGADGTDMVPAASIDCVVDGTPGANDMPGRLVFGTTADGAASPTERMRITSAGLVGIGTTSPGGKLSVVTTTNTPGNSFSGFSDSYLAVQTGTSATSSGLGFGYDSTNDHGLILSVSPSVAWRPIRYIAGDHRFEITGGIEKARIDSSGRLLVGTSTARSNFALGTPTTQFETATSTFNQGLSIINNGGTVGYDPTLILGATRGTAIGSNTAIPSAGYGLGRIDFAGADGTTLITGARIHGVSDGTWGTNDAPSALVFSTTADGAASPTERMRIDSTGLMTLAGPGIKFPATQVASADANTLDDYEEGTFTPTIVGGSTAGTASYSSSQGIYRKIGSLVHFSLVMSWSGGTGTGSLQIANMPFTINTTYLPVFSVLSDSVALSANNTISAFSNLANGIQLMQSPTGGGSTSTLSYDSEGALYITGTYAAT